MDFKHNYRLKSFLDGGQMESRWIYGVHVEFIWNLWGSVKYSNCTRPLTNAHGKGESFCQTHEREFHNCCRVKDSQNNKINRTQACHEHRNDWHRYGQSQSKSSLAGV